jgi:hypothetical protein
MRAVLNIAIFGVMTVGIVVVLWWRFRHAPRFAQWRDLLLLTGPTLAIAGVCLPIGPAVWLCLERATIARALMRHRAQRP